MIKTVPYLFLIGSLLVSYWLQDVNLKFQQNINKVFSECI